MTASSGNFPHQSSSSGRNAFKYHATGSNKANILTYKIPYKVNVSSIQNLRVSHWQWLCVICNLTTRESTKCVWVSLCRCSNACSPRSNSLSAERSLQTVKWATEWACEFFWTDFWDLVITQVDQSQWFFYSKLVYRVSSMNERWDRLVSVSTRRGRKNGILTWLDLDLWVSGRHSGLTVSHWPRCTSRKSSTTMTKQLTRWVQSMSWIESCASIHNCDNFSRNVQHRQRKKTEKSKKNKTTNNSNNPREETDSPSGCASGCQFLRSPRGLEGRLR